MGKARFNALILNADGRNDARVRTTQVLRAAGFEVCGVETGHAALLEAFRRCPDVLLLVMGLCDMSGFDLCRHVKQDPRTCTTMVLEVSGPSAGERVRGLETGADWFLTEPLDDEELIAVLNTLVRLRWTQEQLRQRVDELECLSHVAGALQGRDDTVARLSLEFTAPLDCISTWARILKSADVEKPLRQHGLEAIEHNASLLRTITRELLDKVTRG